jgi:hypothetical protein
MTYDLRRPRLKGLIFRPPAPTAIPSRRMAGESRPFVLRLEARVFRPAIAMFSSNDDVLPFPLCASLHRVDMQFDQLIY